MTEEIIIAGFGGQGILSMGKILAYSAVMQNKEVSWFPSYGPEMRGGPANVIVIISDEKISSPMVNKFDTAILLNQQSLTKFENNIKPGGLLIFDPIGIKNFPVRNDIEIYSIRATDEASKKGISKIFNMVVLGGYLKIKPVIQPEFIRKGLEKSLPSRYHSLIPDNEKAIQTGNEIITVFNKNVLQNPS